MFYVGVDNKARKVSDIYVGVDGVARKVVRAYVGVNGVAQLCWPIAEVDIAKSAKLDYSWRDGCVHSTITKITFVRSHTPTGNENNIWIAAEGEYGPIKCYRTGTEVIIAGDNRGRIILANGSVLFGYCSNLVTIEGLEILDTSLATSMAQMFQGCSKLTALNLSTFNTSNVRSMANMFNGCDKLTSLNLSGFNTSNVTDMAFMFSNCGYYGPLTTLDLTSFDTRNVTNMNSMFSGCQKLNKVLVSADTWKTADQATYMFRNCGCSDVTYV